MARVASEMPTAPQTLLASCTTWTRTTTISRQPAQRLPGSASGMATITRATPPVSLLHPRPIAVIRQIRQGRTKRDLSRLRFQPAADLTMTATRSRSLPSQILRAAPGRFSSPLAPAPCPVVAKRGATLAARADPPRRLVGPMSITSLRRAHGPQATLAAQLGTRRPNFVTKAALVDKLRLGE